MTESHNRKPVDDNVPCFGISDPDPRDAEIQKLKEELREAKKDSDRLDWFSKNCRDIYYLEGKFFISALPKGIGPFNGVRIAIDTVMLSDHPEAKEKTDE